MNEWIYSNNKKQLHRQDKKQLHRQVHIMDYKLLKKG